MTLVVDGRVRRGDFELDVAVRAAAGEVVAVLGPNGAGKSTLLRVAAGLLPLDAGVVRLDGRLLDGPDRFVPPQQRRIGVVFQDHRLFPHLRVLDNVAFGLRSYGVARTPARAAAREWLDRLGLAGLADARPRALSGGQAQRVALARALAMRPGALLLDEPLAALDVQTRADVQGELHTHLARFAGPTLLVTHDPVEALLLATRLVVVERGRVVQQGDPAQITRRPATPYVARLVGVNLYHGTADGRRVVLADGGSLVTTDAPDGPVLVLVRPSAITVHVDVPAPSSARNVWPGEIGSLAPLGDRIRVTVSGAPGGVPTATVDVSPAAVAELSLVPGRPVWLTAKATDVEVYSPGAQAQ